MWIKRCTRITVALFSLSPFMGAGPGAVLNDPAANSVFGVYDTIAFNADVASPTNSRATARLLVLGGDSQTTMWSTGVMLMPNQQAVMTANATPQIYWLPGAGTAGVSLNAMDGSSANSIAPVRFTTNYFYP